MLVICGSYLTICTRLRGSVAPDLQVHNRNLTERNLRLSRAFFIIIDVSAVMFWLPRFVAYVIRELCWGCVSPSVASTVNVPHLANSMVNPFVYSFRMPTSKVTFKERRRRRRTIEIMRCRSKCLESRSRNMPVSFKQLQFGTIQKKLNNV